MTLELDGMQVLAEGGQAKIYIVDDTRILRVPQSALHYDRITFEFDVYSKIQNSLVVPKVFELIDLSGAPCILMERLRGLTLGQAATKNPIRSFSVGKILANKHLEVFGVQCPSSLPSNHEKAEFCITRSQVLTVDQKLRLSKILNSLSEGTSLCHGDFHPENIIECGNGTYIIDWSAASRGSPYFDIANTFLLLMNLPRPPGVSGADHRFRKFFTRRFALQYIRSITKTMGIDPIDLWGYFLVKVAERTYYGLPNEIDSLQRFLIEHLEWDSGDIIDKARREFA